MRAGVRTWNSDDEQSNLIIRREMLHTIIKIQNVGLGKTQTLQLPQKCMRSMQA